MTSQFNKRPVILSNESAKDTISVLSSNNINVTTPPVQLIDTIKEMPYDESAISSVNAGQFTLNGRPVKSSSKVNQLRGQMAQQRRMVQMNVNQRDLEGQNR